MQSRLVIGHWSLVIGHWSLVIGSLVIGSLVIVLTGCTGETATPVSVLPTVAQSPLPLTITPTPIPELQPMIVTLGLWLPEELTPYDNEPGAVILAQQLDDFSAAYPDIQVEVVVKKTYGRGGLLDFLRTARDAAPSVLPDLVVLNTVELEAAAEAGLIQPLDALLSPSDVSERFPFAVEMGMAGEQTVGFVVGVDMEHLAYRPDVLDSPPLSWTQVISPPASFIFPAGGRDGLVDDATLIQYLAAGGKLTDADGRPALDENVLASVLEFYQDCMDAAVISTTVPQTAALAISPTVSLVISPTVVLSIADADGAWERFQNGEGVLTVVRAGRYWLEADEAVAAAPIPTRDGQPFSIARRGWGIAVVADDPARQRLAMLLFNWLIAPDHNGPWMRTAGYLPGTRSALRTWDLTNADRAMLRSVMDAAVPSPSSEVLAATGAAIQKALEMVLRRRASPQQAAVSAVESLEQ